MQNFGSEGWGFESLQARGYSECHRPHIAIKITRRAVWRYLLAALAAATILSKRLSPRKESQQGLKRRSP
jgi:hypothetical protein